jgi:hypothetical protein
MAPDVWHNAASPVSNENSSCYTGTDLIFWYNESLVWNDWNFGWVWYYGATGGPLMVFRGYDVYFATSPVTVSYQATGAETLNTGEYNIAVINTNPAPNPDEIPEHKGWNLVGNPYPSPVDWLAPWGWIKSPAINDAKYIWDGTNNIYTIFEGGPSPIGINGGTRFIPSNQGFWVQAVQNGTISINNTARLGDITGTPDFYKSEPVDYPLVSLIASGNNQSDEMVIRFIGGTREGFDLNYDASKLFSPGERVPQISMKSGNNYFALNTLPLIYDGLEIQITFHCGTTGNYTISLSERTSLDELKKVYLKDDILQKIICLSNDSSYMFYHDPGNDLNRFRLFFNPSEDIINNIGPANWFTVYADKNVITIIKNTVNKVTGEIYVYDLLGQPVMQQDISNEDISTIPVHGSAGYYIVSIVTEGYVSNAKVLIR